jgi:hypothetical protein
MFSINRSFNRSRCGNFVAPRAPQVLYTLKRLFLSGFALFTAIALSACTPSYNWRESFVIDKVASDKTEGPRFAKVLLPGKPATMERSIQLGMITVKMTMMGAKVEDTTFTVAHATLPNADPQTQATALAAMRLQMVRNIQGSETATSEVPISIVDDSGRSVGTRTAQIIQAKGGVKGQVLLMQAGFVADANRVYQWIALGPKLDPDQTKTFIQSFRLMSK